MTAVGTSFTRWRAEALGLDYRDAFTELLRLDLSLIRLSASWREIAEFGWRHLDWLLDRAEEVAQPVVMTVGMKALGWPEFYLPEGLDPGEPAVQQQALAQVRETVDRFRDRTSIVAWQIENEPFNRSGPQGRWIPRAVVRREARAVRVLDPARPIILTTFGHFSADLDRASSRHQSDWKRRLVLAFAAEREALAVLRQGDILGVDVYRSIGWVDAAENAQLARADVDQVQSVARWKRIAESQGKRFWITEAQAEPWEARRATHGSPLTVSPDSVGSLLAALSATGVETVLLWGSEYWLWRAANGDPRWLDAVVRTALA
ncbi:MAG TPA: hypothetical protein VIT43_08685 [Candidatus Dormibacteraeota bacterium]